MIRVIGLGSLMLLLGCGREPTAVEPPACPPSTTILTDTLSDGILVTVRFCVPQKR